MTGKYFAEFLSLLITDLCTFKILVVASVDHFERAKVLSTEL